MTTTPVTRESLILKYVDLIMAVEKKDVPDLDRPYILELVYQVGVAVDAERDRLPTLNFRNSGKKAG